MRSLTKPPAPSPLPMALTAQSALAPSHRPPIPLTRNWGAWRLVSLYLRRCQVDTPDSLVRATWRHVHDIRSNIGTVLDFGAGDGRFAHHGRFAKYIGYEIDDRRSTASHLPHNAELRHRCAFSEVIEDADLCIGNPPFVRNQDLPPRWRLKAAQILLDRTGVRLSGLANAWQYFFLLALASVGPNGLCALVVPYEWVSRPSARAIRDFISANAWNVSVYRLIHLVAKNRLTQYIHTAKSYAAVLSGITSDLTGIVKDNPLHFTFSSVNDGMIEIRDFQTSGVVAFARGTPFITMESGTLSVAGQRVKVNAAQLEQNQSIITKLATKLWAPNNDSET